jgi:hypothetical protein
MGDRKGARFARVAIGFNTANAGAEAIVQPIVATAVKLATALARTANFKPRWVDRKIGRNTV